MFAIPHNGSVLAPTPPGAVRCTTTLTAIPHRDWASGQTVSAVGRHLLHTTDGIAHTRHDNLAVDVDQAGLILPRRNGRTVPEQLRGRPAQRGLRKAVAELRDSLEDNGESLMGPPGGLYDTLLDDVVGTTIASGYGRLQEGPAGPAPEFVGHMRRTCVGFSTMHRRGEEFDTTRYLDSKPLSVEFVSSDPLAWHADRAMTPNSFRRRRMLQVQPGHGSNFAVTGYFRDTFMSYEGVERVVHEYGVTANVSGPPFVVNALKALPGDLPLAYCPLAARSATALEGLGLAEIDGVVRREVAGPASCTHLNDELRSLRLVPALLDFRTARTHH